MNGSTQINALVLVDIRFNGESNKRGQAEYFYFFVFLLPRRWVYVFVVELNSDDSREIDCAKKNLSKANTRICEVEWIYQMV